MSNRISDADIDAILREFSQQQEEETRSLSPVQEETPHPPAHDARRETPSKPVSHRGSRNAPKQPERRRAPAPLPANPVPRGETPAQAFRSSFSLGCVILMLLSLLALSWVGVNVHPGTGTAVASASENRLTLVEKLDVFMNNAASDALGNVAYVKKVYTIPESDLVAPKPDPAKFGSTDDPSVVQAVVDSAAELLDGQTLIWNPDIQRMEGTEIQYYCDETILVIAWKEAINYSACTFVEVKIAHGSQLRRALSDNSYGSSVQMYPTQMAENANAVLAMNGDFYGHRSFGITVYQRQLYRFNPKNLETCFFTASGDMIFSHAGELADEEATKKFVADNDVTFSVSFGPILVENGEKKTTSSYPLGEIDAQYSRSAIGQVDKLHYLLMAINEEGGCRHRVDINDAAEYIYAKNVLNAYALDGGQTSTIVMQGKTVNRPDWGNERLMTDIIYFATAIPEEEASP